MNTRTVDLRTMWTVVAMEAALALPIMSLPAQGDRLTGLAGPLLLLMLLPLGYLGVFQFRELRDPSWRLLIGIGLALLTRLVVSDVPEASLSGLFVWLGRSFVPAVIGVALWWRGAALAVAELTPADVRTEFSVVALCLLVALALMRPFLLPSPLLLGGAVGLFAVSGLLAAVLSRQDAAEVVAPRFSGTLAAITGLIPAGVAVLLVGALRPELLGTMWFLLGRAIELALTPLGLLLAWLGSLFPRIAPGAPPAPLSRPTPEAINPATLAEAQERLAWVGTFIAITLLVAVGLAAVLAARLLLQNWIGDPRRQTNRKGKDAEMVVETTGAPRDDAADVLGWLMRWLRSRFAFASKRRAGMRPRSSPADVAAFDAWAAYQRLLGWAERQGLARRPAETTGQLSARLAKHVPEAADAVALVTQTYEWERYGAVHPPGDRLRRLRDALHVFSDR